MQSSSDADAAHLAYEPFERDTEFLRAMISWEGDTRTGGPMSKLTGRSLAANLDDQLVAIVLVSYELDKSSMLDAMAGRHVLVVDAIATNPSLPSQSGVLVDAGVNRALMDLASIHSMRIEFKPPCQA